MTRKKWLAPLLPYFAAWAGLFLFHSAWLALTGFHAAIVFTILILRPDVPVRILGRSRRPERIPASVLFCAASGIGLYLFWNIFGVAKDLPAQLERIGLNSSTWPLFIAYFSLVNPLLEEYFWRGMLGDPSKKPVIGDLVYAGYHVMILWDRAHPAFIAFAVIILVSAGWLWRQIAREDDGLLTPVLGHMAADLAILLTIFQMTN
jgi:hypothetical protein